RLLPSDLVSFNLWVALPLPIAALGMYAFLRLTHSHAASAVGAIAFGLSGPIASMLNAPNLAWSVAMMPYVVLAAGRLIGAPSARTASMLAVVVALQALCGEPVTLAATSVMVAAFAIWRGAGSEKEPHRIRALTWTLAGLALGALLASVQLWPTISAGVRA